MTIVNILRKPVLFSLAVFAVYNIGCADAFNPRTQDDKKPSIEINLDVLDKLAGNPASVATPGGSPFGEPTSATHPLKKSEKTKKHAKHEQKKKVAKSAKPKKEVTAEVKAVTPPAVEEPSPVVVPLPEKTVPKPPKQPVPDIQPMPAPTSQEAPPLPMLAPTPSVPAAPSAPAQKASTQTIQLQSLQPLPPSNGNAVPAPPARGGVTTEAVPLPPFAPATGTGTPPVKEAMPPVPPPSGMPSLPSALPAPPLAPPTSSANAPVVSDVVAIPPLPSPPTSMANATPAGNAAAPDLQIVFSSNETDVPLNSTGKLDEIAMKLIKNPDLRASIIAYASGADAISIYPKRVSLARGIAVRDYLTTARNIDVERVTVKALGNKSESGPADRVDLFLIK